MNLLLDLTPEPKEPICKGLFFRVSVSAYRSKDTITMKREYRLLKKRSCSGCSQCSMLWDDLAEQNYLVIEAGQHGDVVQVRVTNLQTDWETGYADSWDLQFFVRKENNDADDSAT